MRAKRIEITMELLLSMLDVGNGQRIGDDMVTFVSEPIPADAKPLHFAIDSNDPRSVYLVIESETFEEIPEASIIPPLTPCYRRELIDAS